MERWWKRTKKTPQPEIVDSALSNSVTLRLYQRDDPHGVGVEVIVFDDEKPGHAIISGFDLAPEDAIIYGTAIKSIGYKAVAARNAAGRTKA